MHTEYTYFWSGEFSNWYQRKIYIGDSYYNCVEQYMMYCKAKLFDDYETANQIIHADSPKVQKALGRQVKNFNQARWEKIARTVVYQGNYAKYTQHVDLMEKLLDTNNTTLVEASPYDRIWGIGYTEEDAEKNISNWGKNWLGEVLTKVRNNLENCHAK